MVYGGGYRVAVWWCKRRVFMDALTIFTAHGHQSFNSSGSAGPPQLDVFDLARASNFSHNFRPSSR